MLVAIVSAGCATLPSEGVPHACHAGAYRLSTGDAIVISPSTEGTLRYLLADGRSGRLYPRNEREFYSGDGWAEPEPVIATASLGSCADGRLEFRHRDGPTGAGQRIHLPQVPIRFDSLGYNLYGELFLPPDARPRALVVLVYGSGRDAATTFNYLQHLLPLHGIATFVYDKRGTGRSDGRYTADFSALADDALAALAAAREHLPDAGIPSGFLGESQGGWIAPLAAARAPVDFVVVSYGLAIAPLDEDREEVQAELRSQGYGDEVLSKARMLTDITGKVLLSRFTAGMDELERFKSVHASERWLQQVEGDFTGLLVRTPADQMQDLRELLSFDIILDYDAEAALRRVEAPMLWVVAGSDTEAPSAPTLAVLRKLQARATQLDIAVFPNADHGMIEIEERKGERRLLGRAAGYHDLLAHWILNRKLDRELGSAVLEPDGARVGE